MRHNYIGTEHVLLGLLREEEGVATRVLAALGITIDGVRKQVTQIVGSGEEATTGMIPFTPRAKKVLELALREALSLGHNYIGTEHILLGLVREGEGVAMRILLELDVDAEAIRDQVVRTLATTPDSRLVMRSHATGARWEIDAAWVGGLGPALRSTGPELRHHDDRPPDSGDLLLALAAAPRTRAARALAAVGVDLDALAAAVGEVRSRTAPSAAELAEQLATVMAEKNGAAAAQEYELAARLRDDERALAAALAEAKLTDAELELIRARLGLPSED